MLNENKFIKPECANGSLTCGDFNVSFSCRPAGVTYSQDPVDGGEGVGAVWPFRASLPW